MQRSKTLIVFLAILVSTQVSFCQDGTSEDQRVRRITYALNDLEKLPYTAEEFSQTIMPYVDENKSSMAPHYPDTNALERGGDAWKAVIVSWIRQYPDEYNDYVIYLETYIRSHR